MRPKGRPKRLPRRAAEEARPGRRTRWLIKMALIPCRFDILGLIKNSLSGVNIGSSERFYDILYRLLFQRLI